MQWYYTLTFLVIILACKNEKKEKLLIDRDTECFRSIGC